MMERQRQFLNSFLEEWQLGAGIRAHTSGSTGQPKEIVLPKSLIERSARRTNNFFKIRKSSHLHCAVSFEFIGGKMMIARSLTAGCNLSFCAPSLSPALDDGLHEIDLMSVVPAQLPYILKNKELFSRVRNFLVGGSAINDRLWDKIMESGISAWESYGMTETASHIALRRISGPSTKRPRFIPFSGIRISTDFNGCLFINDEDNFVATNDIVRITKDGSFEILGRHDDVINTGGVKVFPTLIENIIRPYISSISSEFFISSVPDEIWTSKIVLVCVPLNSGNIPNFSDSNENFEYLRDKINKAFAAIPESVLPRRLRPKEIRFIGKLPLSSSGKLIRRIN